MLTILTYLTFDKDANNCEKLSVSRLAATPLCSGARVNKDKSGHDHDAHRAAAAVAMPSSRPDIVCDAHATKQDILECLDEQGLKLANGKSVPIVNGASVRQRTDTRSNMPVVKGQIGNTLVETLRDTGCSTVVVKRDLVKDDELTGKSR